MPHADQTNSNFSHFQIFFKRNVHLSHKQNVKRTLDGKTRSSFVTEDGVCDWITEISDCFVSSLHTEAEKGQTS